MLQRQFLALSSTFTQLARRVVHTLRCPYSLNEIVGMYEQSIPADFHTAADLLINRYQLGNHAFDTNLLQLVVKGDDGTELVLEAHKGSNSSYPEKRPFVPVMFVGPPNEEAALYAYAKELLDITTQVNEATTVFERLARSSSTPAEMFYAFPYYKKFAATTSDWSDYKFPQGRRPPKYMPERYPQDEVEQVNKVLLAGLLCTGTTTSYESSRFSVREWLPQ